MMKGKSRIHRHKMLLEGKLIKNSKEEDLPYFEFFLHNLSRYYINVFILNDLFIERD